MLSLQVYGELPSVYYFSEPLRWYVEDAFAWAYALMGYSRKANLVTLIDEPYGFTELDYYCLYCCFRGINVKFTALFYYNRKCLDSYTSFTPHSILIGRTYSLAKQKMTFFYVSLLRLRISDLKYNMAPSPQTLSTLSNTPTVNSCSCSVCRHKKIHPKTSVWLVPSQNTTVRFPIMVVILPGRMVFMLPTQHTIITEFQQITRLQLPSCFVSEFNMA